MGTSTLRGNKIGVFCDGVGCSVHNNGFIDNQVGIQTGGGLFTYGAAQPNTISASKIGILTDRNIGFTILLNTVTSNGIGVSTNVTSGTISGNNLVANGTGLTVVGGPIEEMQYSGIAVSVNRASNN